MFETLKIELLKGEGYSNLRLSSNGCWFMVYIQDIHMLKKKIVLYLFQTLIFRV